MSDILNINALHNRKLEYKRQNLWILSIDGLDAYTAQSTGRPQLSLGDEMQVNYITTYSVYASTRGKWQPVDFSLNDPIDPSASRKIYDLILKQWNWQTGRIGKKSQYAVDIDIKLLTPDFETSDPKQPKPKNSIIEIWTLHNAFFTNINWNGAPLDYDSTDRLKVDFSVTYDWAEPTFIDVKL